MAFPQEIHSFPIMQDVQASDIVDVARYKVLYNKGTSRTPAEDTELNNLKTTLDNKNFNAPKINAIYNAIIELETFFRDNTVGYIETKQDEFQAEIDKFSDKGEYNPTTKYYQKNFVSFNDGSGVKTYICINDNSSVGIIGIDPTNGVNWKLLTITGEKGEDGIGIGLTLRGEWDNSRTYAKDEGVQFGGLLFASCIDNNVNNQPDIAQDTVYWSRVLDVTVTTTELNGVRTLVSQTSNMNFITGEIVSFNPSIDSLSVTQNTVKLIKGIHYTINADNQSVDKINGTWDGTPEKPIVFEFTVIKNIVNNLVFSDGSAIEEGTVAKTKLTTDVQSTLDQVQINQNDIATNNNSISDIAGIGRTVETVKQNADDIVSVSTQIDILIQNKVDKDGTLQTNLNADMLDGKHATEIQSKFASGIYTGDDTLSRKIVAGFQPKEIILFDLHDKIRMTYFYDLHMIFKDKDVTNYYYVGSSVNDSFFTVDTTGFTTSNVSSALTNCSTTTYYWVAKA